MNDAVGRAVADEALALEPIYARRTFTDQDAVSHVVFGGPPPPPSPPPDVLERGLVAPQRAFNSFVEGREAKGSSTVHNASARRISKMAHKRYVCSPAIFKTKPKLHLQELVGVQKKQAE